MDPWEDVSIDLIGPRKVKGHGKLFESNALTYIDTASNLVGLIQIDNKTASHIRNKFIQCVHDKRGEFIGQKFPNGY